MNSIRSIGTILLILFLLSEETWARPALKDKNQCSPKKCSGKQNLAVYQVGKTYTFSYQSLHNNDIADATEEKSSLMLTSKVKVSVLSPCEMQLEMTEVKFSDTITTAAGEETNDYQMAVDMLQKVPMRFSFDNGIVTGVCPNKGENKFAANIKRSIISQLQNSMESIDSSTYVAETDVVGNCLTEYRSVYVADAPFRHINKKKAISGCSKKHEFSTVTNGEPYDMPLDMKKLTLLDGSYECTIKQEYNGNLLESKCTEIHKFNPMQASDDTINMKITTSLVHEKTEDTGTLTPSDPEYLSDLLFDHKPIKVKYGEGELDGVLKSLCNSIKNQPDNIPKDFSNLLDLMKEMNVEQLNNLHDKIMKDACDDDQIKSMFHDAVPLIQTDSSIELMMNELKESEEHSINDDTWLASLAFIRKPSLKMIKLSLDGIAKTNNKALIMSSSMIKKYCAQDSACADKTEIQEFVNFVKGRITECDTTDVQKVEDILSALRAVENMGGDQAWDKSLSEQILTCKGNVQIQSAAISSLQTIQCEKLNMISIEDLFRDRYTANEVRIKAYKILMKCEYFTPVEEFIKSFNSDIADSAQVASFVHSHLTNVLQISDSYNVAKRSLIARVNFKKFGRRAAKSPLSFSQNINRNFKLKRTKANVEADVIFADESFLPRNLAVNLTMDMWGQKVNVLDLNLRQEGFEIYVKQLLNLQSQSQSGSEDNKNKYNKFDSETLKWLGKQSNNPQFSIGARIFGNELVFKNNIDVNNVKNNMMLKLSMLMSSGLSGKSSRTTKVIDLGISTPTVSGIPLELKVDGILSSKLEYNLKLSNEALIKIIPRVALQVVGTFRLNAHCTKIGVQATLTALVNRNLDTKMVLTPKKEGYSISFEQAAVDNRQDFINLKAELGHLTNKGVKTMTGKGEKVSVNQCTPNVLYEKLDLRYCVVYTHPRGDKSQGDPGFPFAGPTNVQIYVEKHSGLTFDMRRDMPTEDSENKLIMIALGNMKNRESLLFKYQYTKSDSEKSYKLKVNGMGGSYEVATTIDGSNKLTGTYKRNDEVKASLKGQYGGGKDNRHFSFQVDKDKEKVASIEYRSKRVKNKGESVHFEADIATYFPMKLSLKRTMKQTQSDQYSNKKFIKNYILDVTLGKTKPHEIKASLNMVKENFGKVRQQVFKYVWKSGDTIFLSVKNDFKIKLFNAKGKEDSSISGEALEIELTHQTKRPEKTIKFTFATSFFASQYLLRPSLRQPKLFEHSTKITFPDDPTNTLTCNMVAKIKVPNRRNVDIKFLSAASWPKMNVDQNHLALINWNLEEKSPTANIELKYQPATDRVTRIYLQHQNIEQGMETTFGLSARSYNLKVQSLFAQPKHTLTITRNEDVFVLASAITVKNIPEKDDQPSLSYYDIATDITKNSKAIANQKLGIGFNMNGVKALKIDYALNSLDNGERLLCKVAFDSSFRYKPPNLSVVAKVEIPAFLEKNFNFKFDYSCEGETSICKHNNILKILKDDQVVKRYGYKSELNTGVMQQDYEVELYTGDPKKKEEFKFGYERSKMGLKWEMELKLTKYGEYKLESETKRSPRRTEAENKITIKHIDPDNPYNGVYKESAIAEYNNVNLKLDYSYEFMPAKNDDSYKLTASLIISKKQNNWNEIVFTLSPNLASYGGYQKVGLRFKSNKTPADYNLDVIALYRGLLDKSDQSISFNLNFQANPAYSNVQLSASLNSTIEATQFKSVVGTLRYQIKENYGIEITAVGKFDDQFINLELSSPGKVTENGATTRNFFLTMSSSIEAIASISSSLAVTYKPSDSIAFVLEYNRNKGQSTVNSDLTINFRTRPLTNIKVGVVFGWTTNLYGNGKFDIGASYNAAQNTHKIQTSIVIGFNKFSFNSGFNFNLTLGSTVMLNYDANIQTENLIFTAIGSAKAINGIPLSTKNEVKLNNEQVLLFQFTVLKVLSVDFKLNIGQKMPQFAIQINGEKFKSDDLDVSIMISMNPIIKPITQKIVYYNKMGQGETLTVDDKKASFYIKLDTTTEYSDFAKLGLSAMLTEDMQVYGTVEANAPVLGPTVQLTKISITGITLDKNKISGVMKIEGTVQYDISLSYDFKSMTDMNAQISLSTKMENPLINNMEASYSIKDYNIKLLVEAKGIVKLELTTSGDSWRNMNGNFGLSVATTEPGYAASFEFLFPEDPKGDKVFKLDGHFLGSDGEKVIFKYSRVLKTSDSTRSPGTLRRELVVEGQYSSYPIIKLTAILEASKNPFVKLTLDYNKPAIADITIDIDRSQMNYLLSANVDSTYGIEISLKKSDDYTYLFSINSNGYATTALTASLTIEQKLVESSEFLTTITAESEYLEGLLNSKSKKRIIKTTALSLLLTRIRKFEVGKKVFYFYIDNDFQLELTRTAKYGASLMVFPKFTDKDKTVLTFNLDLDSETKTLTITLTSPYSTVSEFNFVVGFKKGGMGEGLLTSSLSFNNKAIYDASFDQKVKPVENESPQFIQTIKVTGYITLTIYQEIRLRNPFVSSKSQLPLYKQDVDADLTGLMEGIKFKRSLLFVNSRTSYDEYNQQAYYKFENDLRNFVLEYQFSSERSYMEFSIDKRKDFTLSFEVLPTKYQLKTLVRTIEISVEPTVTVFKSFNNLKPNEGSATFTFSKSPDSPENAYEGTLTSNLFDYPLVVSMKTGERMVLLTIKREGKEPAIRLKYYCTSNFKLYAKANLEIDLNLKEGEQFVKYRGEIAVYKSRTVEASQTLTTQSGSREFTFVYKPWRKLLITDNDLYRLELFYNRDYKGLTYKTVLLYKPSDFTYQRITTVTFSPWRFSNTINTDLGDVKFDIQALGPRMYSMNLIRVKKTGEVVSDSSWTAELNENNLFVFRSITSPSLIRDYKNVFAEIYDPSRLLKIRESFFSDIRKANSKLFDGFSNPFEGNQKLVEYFLAVYGDYSSLGQKFVQIYTNDEFYMKTIWTAVSPFLSSLSSQINNFKMRVLNYVKRGGLYGKLYRFGKMISAAIPDDLHIKYLKMDYKITNIVIRAFYKCTKRLAELASTGTGKVKSLMSVIMKKLQLLKDRKMPEWLIEHRTYVINNYEKALQELTETDFKEFYESEMNPTMNKYKELRQGMVNMRKNVKKLGTWLRGYITNRSGLKERRERIARFSKMITNGEFTKLYDELMKPDLFKIEFDEQVVSYNVEIYMSPGLLKFLKRAIKMKVYITKKLVGSASKLQGSLVANAYYKMRYYLSNYGSKQKMIENLLPPYKQQAWLILDNQGKKVKNPQVISYSNRIKASVGLIEDCNLLLTRNVFSKDFTVIYMSGDTEAIVVQNPSSDAEVKITLDGKVYNGDNAISLPKRFNKFLVTRDGQRIRVSTASGALVDVYTKLRSVKVEVPGIWHAQMVGLFGTNDYNTFRDFLKPSGISSNYLIDPWSLSDNCASRRQTGVENEQIPMSNLKLVQASVGRCFPVVNPKPYLRAGFRMGKESAGSSDFQDIVKAACPVINAYTLRCRESGISVYSPQFCKEKCEESSKKKPEVEALKSMLYIFVIEESSCTMAYKQQFKDITEALTKRRSTDMFSLITYKGNRKGSSTYTNADGKDVFTKDELVAIIDELELSGNLYMGTGSTEALYTALMFPLANGRMHSVYMFACDRCMPHPSYTSGVLMGLMRRKKINVQYFSIREFQENNVVGVGPKVAYKIVEGEVVKDSNIYGLNLGRNVCSAVARTLGGGVAWSLKAIQDSKVDTSKVYENVLNASIGSEFYSKYNNKPQKCSCIRDPYGSMQESCNF